jgi:hypothetical protein
MRSWAALALPGPAAEDPRSDLVGPQHAFQRVTRRHTERRRCSDLRRSRFWAGYGRSRTRRMKPELRPHIDVVVYSRACSWEELATAPWCRRRRSGVRKVVADAGPVTARRWPRSSSWPRRVAPDGSSRRSSALRGPRSTGASRSGAGTGVWARLHHVILDELGARDELDWSDVRSTP